MHQPSSTRMAPKGSISRPLQLFTFFFFFFFQCKYHVSEQTLLLKDCSNFLRKDYLGCLPQYRPGCIAMKFFSMHQTVANTHIPKSSSAASRLILDIIDLNYKISIT